MRFYLGTHEVAWLWQLDVPLFVHYGRLARRKTLPRATARWALDSGAYSELLEHGTWRITPAQYAAAVRRWHQELGGMD